MLTQGFFRLAQEHTFFDADMMSMLRLFGVGMAFCCACILLAN